MGTSSGGLLRDYIPKGTSIERYSDEDVLSIADELNQRPRRILGYHTPAEPFQQSSSTIFSMKSMLLINVLD